MFVGEVSFLTGAGDCEQWPPELQPTTFTTQNVCWVVTWVECMLYSSVVGIIHVNTMYVIPGLTKLMDHDDTTFATGRPEPNTLIFLPIILFCNSKHFSLLFLQMYRLFFQHKP